MKKRYRIDALLLFLLLSMFLLVTIFPEIRGQLTGQTHLKVTDSRIEEQLKYPLSVSLEEGVIKPYNRGLQLLYSLNGGDSFQKANDNKLYIEEIKNPEILYRNTSIRWLHPKGEFTPIKTVLIKLRDEGRKEETKTKVITYLNGVESTLPIVHISISESALFDWNNGIMVLGSASSYDNGFYKMWWSWSANYALRGQSSGRKAFFQYFENGELETETSCELRISGNATRSFPQKSIKLFPLDDYGKRDKLSHSFFKQGNKKTKSILLRQSGNDNTKTMFADLMMHQLATKSHVIGQKGRPVSVYLNGNYWGIYNFRERMDAYFIAKKEDVKENDVTILICEINGGMTLLKEGKEKDKIKFDQLIDDIKSDKDSEQAFKLLKNNIDIASFTDYILFECYYANQDWLHNNVTFYKADDKKWKWALNDLDVSLAYPGENNINANLFEKLKKSETITGWIFRTLIQNSEYTSTLKKRGEEIVKSNFSDSNIDKTYQTLRSLYYPEMMNQINRWRSISSIEQWEKDCVKNITFLKKRRKIFLKQLDSL